MRRIFGLLTAIVLALSSIRPLSVIRVNAEQYGWVPADTEYFLQRGHSEMPDAIRIELAYVVFFLDELGEFLGLRRLFVAHWIFIPEEQVLFEHLEIH